MLPIKLISTPGFELAQKDCVEWLQGLQPASVDLIITDPAYESMEENRARGTTTRLKSQWFPIFPNERFPELFAEMYRVLKKNTHLYFLCDQVTMFVVKPIAEAAGFKFWKPLIWDKVHRGTGYHYPASYEVILFFEKGKRKLNRNSHNDVLRVQKLEKPDYATKKPVELLKILVEESSNPGDVVADPFYGSGSTAVAALDLGRAFWGTDISPDAHALAHERLGMYG